MSHMFLLCVCLLGYMYALTYSWCILTLMDAYSRYIVSFLYHPSIVIIISWTFLAYILPGKIWCIMHQRATMVLYMCVICVLSSIFGFVTISARVFTERIYLKKGLCISHIGYDQRSQDSRVPLKLLSTLCFLKQFPNSSWFYG